VRRLVDDLLGDAVAKAVAGDAEAAGFANGLLQLTSELGVTVDLDRPQEQVYAALVAGDRPDLVDLGANLGLAADRLGLPD
jgi:hypothetical protein